MNRDLFNDDKLVLLVLSDRTTVMGSLEETTEIEYTINIPLQVTLFPKENEEKFTIIFSSYPISFNQYFLEVPLTQEKISKNMVLTKYDYLDIKSDLITGYKKCITQLKNKYSKELYESRKKYLH